MYTDTLQWCLRSQSKPFTFPGLVAGRSLFISVKSSGSPHHLQLKYMLLLSCPQQTHQTGANCCFLALLILIAATAHCEGTPLVLHPQEESKQCSYWLLCSKTFRLDSFHPTSLQTQNRKAGSYLFLFCLLFKAIHHFSQRTPACGHSLWRDFMQCALFNFHGAWLPYLERLPAVAKPTRSALRVARWLDGMHGTGVLHCGLPNFYQHKFHDWRIPQ